MENKRNAPSGKMRARMPISQRAKQFMPFAAVTGLELALAKKERELGLAPPRELSEESADELNAALLSLRKGDHVSLLIYEDGEYLPVTGTVTRIDETFHEIDIDEQRFPMGAIAEITGMEPEE